MRRIRGQWHAYDSRGVGADSKTGPSLGKRMRVGPRLSKRDVWSVGRAEDSHGGSERSDLLSPSLPPHWQFGPDGAQLITHCDCPVQSTSAFSNLINTTLIGSPHLPHSGPMPVPRALSKLRLDHSPDQRRTQTATPAFPNPRIDDHPPPLAPPQGLSTLQVTRPSKTGATKR